MLNSSEERYPILYDLNEAGDLLNYRRLLEEKPYIRVYDTVRSQLRELMRCRRPSEGLTDKDLDDLTAAHLKGTDVENYGRWVYYPWSERLVHFLPDEEFIELRTDRNRNKITIAERDLLRQKTIGVVGLSVGQSVALTLAMERGCGCIKIADFDTLEITNLNRIRAGVHNLSLKKTVVVAREIAEIDPYLKVICFDEGLTENNMQEFFFGDSKLDIIIDECDGLNTKLKLRQFARRHAIPVLMDTSDRGMLDIERFDLEPNRPLFHGLIDEALLPQNDELLTDQKRIELSVKIAGMDQISPRLKASIPEIRKTLSTWPQLASSVTMGGGATAEVCRLILLDEVRASGRFYIDIKNIVS